MTDLLIVPAAPAAIRLNLDEMAALSAALAPALDQALSSLTVDPSDGQPHEDYDAACARVERAFAPCRAAYRDHSWALEQIEALAARLRGGLARGCPRRGVAPAVSASCA